MNYYQKYLKYKNKYLELKKFQIYGGVISDIPITICGIELQNKIIDTFIMGNGIWEMTDNNGIRTFYAEVPTTATIHDRLDPLYNDRSRYTIRMRMDAGPDLYGFFNTVIITENATGITLRTRY